MENQKNPEFSKNALLYLDHINYGDYDKMMQTVISKTMLTPEAVERYASKNKHSFITIFDYEYPHTLQMMKKPPFVIFYKGDLNVLTEDLYFLIGNNTINIPKEQIIKLSFKTGKISIGGRLTLWITSNNRDINVAICHALSAYTVMGSKILYSESTSDKFNEYTTILSVCKNSGKFIYAIPTELPSLNNLAIKNGFGKLIDRFEDLEEYYDEEKSFGADAVDDDEDTDNDSCDDNKTEEPPIDFDLLPDGLKDLIDAVKNNKIEISGFKITGDDLEKILGKKKKKEEKPEEIII